MLVIKLARDNIKYNDLLLEYALLAEASQDGIVGDIIIDPLNIETEHNVEGDYIVMPHGLTGIFGDGTYKKGDVVFVVPINKLSVVQTHSDLTPYGFTLLPNGNWIYDYKGW